MRTLKNALYKAKAMKISTPQVLMMLGQAPFANGLTRPMEIPNNRPISPFFPKQQTPAPIDLKHIHKTFIDE